MGMRPPVVFAPIFVKDTPRNLLYSFLAIRDLMEGLCKANIHFLRLYPNVPLLYESGVVYKPENGTEEWLTIPYVIGAGWGDCEDLACWRAAELIVKYGIPAKPDVRARKIDDTWRAHAIVRLPDGSVEDPSLKLGMPKGGVS